MRFHLPRARPEPLDQLTALRTSLVLRLLPQALRVNGRYVLVGDDIKIPKQGAMLFVT